MEQKNLWKGAFPISPNRKGAMQKAWITASYQKWPKRMPGALPLKTLPPLPPRPICISFLPSLNLVSHNHYR